MTEARAAPVKTLPAALLTLWAEPSVVKKLERIDPRGLGLRRLDLNRWLFPVLPGDAAVFDRAARLGWRLLQALATELGQGKVRALIAPTAVAYRQNEPELIPDGLTQDLDVVGRELPPDVLHLTGHAARNLEGRWVSAAGPPIRLRSGSQVPTLILGPGAPGLPPWRNPELLGRVTRWLPLTEEANQLGELLVLPIARLSGTLGVGKTRLAWEVLRAGHRTLLWRRGGADPAEPEPPIDQWLRSERRRPIWVIYDTLESADPGTWAELLALAQHPELGKGLHLLLIGRSGTIWPPALETTPLLEVAPLKGDSWDRLAQQMLHGLGLPLGLVEQLLEVCQGNPFALEEALLQLVRERQLRQVLGSFFYSGSNHSREIRSSSRFRLQVEAELLRLGAADPMRWLGLTSEPVPASELTAVTFDLTGVTPEVEWDQRVQSAQLAEARLGPWGEGLRPALPLVAHALLEALDETEQQRARRALGELLAARSTAAAGLWGAWSLLRRSPEGAQVALEALGSGDQSGREGELFEAALEELQAAAARGNDPDLELELLWVLVPLARRMGRLPFLQEFLERALDRPIERAERQLALSVALAEIDRRAGRLLEAERRLRQALERANEVEDRKKQIALLELGSVLVSRGRRQEAREILVRLLEIGQSSGQLLLAANSSFLLGNLALRSYQLDEAEQYLSRALELQRETTGPASQIRTLCALAALEANRGNFPTSLARYREAEALMPSSRNRTDHAWILTGKGRVLLRLGDFHGANKLLREALQLRESEGDEVGMAIVGTSLAEVLLELGQIEAAQAEARRALFALCLSGIVEAEAEAERVLGRILIKQRRSGEALPHLEQAAEIARSVGDQGLLLEALTGKLQAAIALEETCAIGEGYRELLAVRQGLPPNYFTISADLALAQAAERLLQEDSSFQPASNHLAAAYSELMRETGYLADPTLRQHFLFQVPAHTVLLEAARQKGLSIPTS